MRLPRSLALRAALLGMACVMVQPLVSVTPGAVAQARSAPDSFADLAARLLPAVVNISSSQVVQTKGGAPGTGPEVPTFPPGSPFEQFFKDFLNRNRPPGGRGDGAGAHRMLNRMR